MKTSMIAVLVIVAVGGISSAWAGEKAGSLKQHLVGTWSVVSQSVEQGDKK